VATITADLDAGDGREKREMTTDTIDQAARLYKEGLNWPGVNVVKEEVVVAQTGIRDQRGMPGR
jgi:hypothetical protein